MIVKLPEQCPLTVLRLGQILLDCGLPPEGMQMLTGFPRDLGDELLTSPEYRTDLIGGGGNQTGYYHTYLGRAGAPSEVSPRSAAKR